MSDLAQITINQTIAYLFATANKKWPHIASYDDWSDVYKVVEFANEREETPSSSMPNNQGGSECTFYVCLAIAAIINFFLCN